MMLVYLILMLQVTKLLGQEDELGSFSLVSQRYDRPKGTHFMQPTMVRSSGSRSHDK